MIEMYIVIDKWLLVWTSTALGQTQFSVWNSHQKVWRLNIHCDNSLVVDMAE